MLAKLADFWENTLLPAIDAVWAFIQDYLVPLFVALWEVLEVAGKLAIEELAGLWENVLQPALETVWEFIQDKVIPILEDVWSWISEKVGPVVQDLADGALVALESGFEKVKDAISWVTDKLKILKDWLSSITIPDWLIRTSPSPFEMSFIGAADAIDRLTDKSLPKLRTELALSIPELIPGGTSSSMISHTYQFPGSGFTPESEESIVDRMRLFHLTLGEPR